MILTKKEYNEILDYYNVNINNKQNLKTIKKAAENIVLKKLCRCIKSVDQTNMNNESKAIAICNNSVLKNKNLKISKFTCKNKRYIQNLSKKNKNIYLNKTKKYK